MRGEERCRRRPKDEDPPRHDLPHASDRCTSQRHIPRYSERDPGRRPPDHDKLLELSAKGGKLVSSGALTSERVCRGVTTVKRDEELEKIRYTDEDVLKTSISLRSLLSDYLDCIILSSAINRCDVLLTEDTFIHALTKDEQYRRIVREVNPEFTISSHKVLPSLM
jgi:hypothetical protein